MHTLYELNIKVVKMNPKLQQLVQHISFLHYDMNAQLTKAQQQLFVDNLPLKQTMVLDYIHQHKACTMGELADFMETSASAVSQIIGRLEKERYVQRQINPKNRREIMVLLDLAGERYFAREQEINTLIINKIYSKMPIEDLEKLNEILTQLHQIVEETNLHDLEQN